jgi:hypothetical protein
MSGQKESGMIELSISEEEGEKKWTKSPCRK